MGQAQDEPPHRRRTRIVLLTLAVIGVGLGVGYLVRRAPEPLGPVEHHNAVLAECGESATAITIVNIEHGPGHTPKRVELSNPSEIQIVLNALKVTNPNQKFGRQHKCLGHIRFSIAAQGVQHDIQYDHASSIYPARPKEASSPRGMLNLDPVRLAPLNSLLISKGFTKEEIGLHE